MDENYDPTDFLQGLVPGEAQPFQPPPMVNIQFNPFLFAGCFLFIWLQQWISGDGRRHNHQARSWGCHRWPLAGDQEKLSPTCSCLLKPSISPHSCLLKLIFRTIWPSATTATTKTRTRGTKCNQNRSLLIRMIPWPFEGRSIHKDASVSRKVSYFLHAAKS